MVEIPGWVLIGYVDIHDNIIYFAPIKLVRLRLKIKEVEVGLHVSSVTGKTSATIPRITVLTYAILRTVPDM